MCDCKPAYLYVAFYQKCYAAYTKGPCKDDEILTATAPSGIPQCVKNECPLGHVFFNNNCYPLNREDGCKEYEKIIGRKVYLYVNPTTLQLGCLDSEEQYICANNCCKGSLRDIVGNCT